jgi:hypothetical protein
MAEVARQVWFCTSAIAEAIRKRGKKINGRRGPFVQKLPDDLSYNSPEELGDGNWGTELGDVGSNATYRY